jgi:hypothetical protein
MKYELGLVAYGIETPDENDCGYGIGTVARCENVYLTFRKAKIN